MGGGNHPRVKVIHPVLYSSDIFPSLRTASTLELSLEGIKIETPYTLEKGEGLEIYIGIHSKVIKCRGCVADTEWRDGEKLKARVEFEEISKEDGLYLAEYISHISSRRDQKAVSSLSGSLPSDRRKYRRVPVDFPVICKIEEKTIRGQALNRCNKGLMVEYYLDLRVAHGLIDMLFYRPLYIGLQFICNEKTYSTEGELRHFHLNYKEDKGCTITIGVCVPEIG